MSITFNFILVDRNRNNNNTILDLDSELTYVKSELVKARAGTKYYMHDPTFSEVEEFISQDTTNEFEYVNDTFTCKNYAQVVNNNAEELGIRCAYVVLMFKNGSHAIVGFNTTDRGMIYIEPQEDDLILILEIGKQYWTECVIPKDDTYYYDDPEDYDDTIIDILLYW
jgi:hypothetical protein